MDGRSILTERLCLRPFTVQDEGRVITLLNDLRVSQWLGRVPHPFTAAECRITGPGGESRWPDLMAVTQHATLVGCVGTAPHLGYWLAPSAWGQGIATEAARAALRYVFDIQGRADIASGYFLGNTASRRVLEKLGFRETGLSRQHCAAQSVERDHMGMGLDRRAWEAAA